MKTRYAIGEKFFFSFMCSYCDSWLNLTDNNETSII